MSKEFDKKELREDAFVDGFFRASDWIRKNSRQVVKYTTIVLMAVVVAGVWRFQSLKTDRAVAEKLFTIMSLFQQGRADGAEEALRLCRETAKSYPKSRTLDAVFFYEGNCLFRLGRFDEALQVYENFLVRYPEHVHTPLVLSNIALAYEEKGEYEKARDVLHNLLDHVQADYMQPQIKLDLARIEHLAGNSGRARELYEEIIRDYGESEYASLAESQKDFL